MLLIACWVGFPLLLAALGAGWGALIERAAGVRLPGALLIASGLAGVIVVGGLLMTWKATAPAATYVCGIGALVGLGLERPWTRLSPPPALTAIGVIAAYGAPVLAYGHPTWLGYLRLDDTATWFNVIDLIGTHGHGVAGLPQSTFTLVDLGDVGKWYPRGAFVVPAVSRAIVHINIAWVFDPYLAFCGAGLGLGVYALGEPLLPNRWTRAIVAFLAAQPALLYGFDLWGGIKELTSAMLLVLCIALAAQLAARRPERGRELIPVAVAAGALLGTLGLGAAAWLGPAALIVVGVWARRAWADRGWRGPLRSLVWLCGLTAVAIVPVWVSLGAYLSADSGLFSSGESAATRLGNLYGALSGWQLGGIWTVGDFRLHAGWWPTAPLLVIVGLAAVEAMALCWRRHQFGLPLYVATVLIACAISWLAGANPWAISKTLAISSPAVLACALVGAAALITHHAPTAGADHSGESLRARTHARRAVTAGAGVVLAVLAFGVLWSNTLGYHDATIAPYNRMSELAHMSALVKGKGPTLINDYEVYADRHFLGDGAPVEPAEYRYPLLTLTDGAVLTKSAEADLDAFPVATIEQYRSIVVPNSPVESRPPSDYRLVYSGEYYQLYQRAAHPATTILDHVALGDQGTHPYCGNAENAAAMSICPTQPTAVESCPAIHKLGRTAAGENAELVAYQRPEPVVLYGDQTLWPGLWVHDDSAHTLTATTPGTATAHIRFGAAGTFELWLGGDFSRGFSVSVDGRPLGHVANQLFAVPGYTPIGKVSVTRGVHTVRITYPHAGLGPGSGDNTFTSLSDIALQPLHQPTRMLTVSPARAGELCGKSLDWIEIVRS